MTLKNAMRLFLTTALLQAPAVAQSRFCVGGNLDALTPVQKDSCTAKLRAVRRVAAALHAPDDWHFVLVCGEQGWNEYAAYAKGSTDALANRVAETDLVEHETFLRETRLDATELSSLQGIIAHEIAAAALRSNDEIAIRQEIARRSSTLATLHGVSL